MSRKKGCERGPLVRSHRCSVDGRGRLQHLDSAFERRHFAGEGLVLLRSLAPPFELRLRARGVGQHELELERGQVVEWVAATDDVRVLERAQHVQDRVDLADAAEELVAEPLPRVRALLDAGDVSELRGGLDDLLRGAHLGEGDQSVIRHFGDADVRLGGGERVRGHRGLAAGQRVEKRGLAGVGQPDDAEALHDWGQGTRTHRLLTQPPLRWVQ